MTKQYEESKNQTLVHNSRSAMIFAATWALLLGVSVYLRLPRAVQWQDYTIEAVYGVSALFFLVAVFLFNQGKEKAAKILSLLGYYPGLVVGSLIQGGGNSVLILVVISVAFTMMYGLMVEPKTTRNRFILYGLVFVAVNLGLYFIPFSFRLVVTDSGGSGLPITIATAVIALFLIITQARQGIRLFRNAWNRRLSPSDENSHRSNRSPGFKLGVGFAVSSLITLGFMAFAITTLTRVSVDFDYTRFADFEQIYANDLKAEITGMAVQFNEFLLKYKTEGIEEAYTAYLGEYEHHSSNAQAVIGEFDTLQEKGWGDYNPAEDATFQKKVQLTPEEFEATAAAIRAKLG